LKQGAFFGQVRMDGTENARNRGPSFVLSVETEMVEMSVMKIRIGHLPFFPLKGGCCSLLFGLAILHPQKDTGDGSDDEECKEHEPIKDVSNDRFHIQFPFT
jgi:hypothetical protein